MIETSALWKELWRNPRHEEEVKLTVAGVEYTHNAIVDNSLNITGGMFETFDIGNCAARQMDVVFFPNGTIPKRAEIKVEKRLVWHERTVSAVVEHASEWIPNGVFYISQRQKNKITGTLTVHCFDAMLKAGQVWLTADYAHTSWPKTENEAVTDIAARMGVTIDKRTHLDNRFPIGYPVDENGELTMTDVLEGIAVANYGNWIITEAGELLLVRIGDQPEETYYLVEQHGRPIQFGSVVIWLE